MKTTTASALRLTKALSGGPWVTRNSSKEWAYRSAWVLTPWLPLTGCVTQASVSLAHAHKRGAKIYHGRLLRILLG